jgi:hypothetical protein
MAAGMTRFQFIIALVSGLGGLGIGSLLTTLITKWLDVRTERTRWLRDRRYAAYSVLTKELMSMGVWSGTTTRAAALGIAAEARLLLDDEPLAQRIDAFFADLAETSQRLSSEQSREHRFVSQEEEDRRRSEFRKHGETEYQRLRKEANAIADALRQQLLRQ